MLGDSPVVGQLIVDLDPGAVSIQGSDPNPAAGPGLEPVWVGQLEGQRSLWPQVPAGDAKALRQAEDVGGHHDQVELPAEIQVFDSRVDELDIREAAMQALQHPGVAVDPDQLDAGRVQRDGEPARPDAEVEDRRLGRLSELEPGPEVAGIR